MNMDALIEISHRIQSCVDQLEHLDRVVCSQSDIHACDAIVSIDDEKYEACMSQLDQISAVLQDMPATVSSMTKITPCPPGFGW